MKETSSSHLTNDEKLIALFSHLSLFLGGIILPLIFWIINKDKSKFATFHSLQALFFHITYVILIFVLIFFFALAGVGFGFIATAARHNAGGAGGAFVFILIAFYAFLFVYIFGCMGYAIYMGIKAYNGELKKYPVIGRIVYNHVYKEGN